MKVLSLWQPWATLCSAPDPAHGGRPAKVHETRHWPPDHPLPIRVAIHATKRCNREVLATMVRAPFYGTLQACGFYPGDPRPFERRGVTLPYGRPLPFGAIIGVATVVDVVPTMVNTSCFTKVNAVDAYDLAFGNWSPGRFAWRLAHTAMLEEPIPFVGRQQALYPVPGDVLAQIMAQLQAVRA